MLLPSCNHCGQCGCVCGALPYTVTVEFSGLQNKTHGQHCSLSFSSCFGSGAEAVAMSPGGYDPEDRGPLSQVLLLSGGCGYAKLGRVQPEVGISGSGTGATFTPTLAEDEDACGCKFWKLTAVSVSGGTGYADAETLKISIDGQVITQPVAVLSTGREEPTVTADPPASGIGAELSVTLSSNGGDPETWGVATVVVTDGGTGYTNGESVVFSTPDSEQVAAIATVNVDSSQPSVPLTFETATGSGASLTLNWTQSGGQWCATSVTINSGGSGYTVGDSFFWQDFDLSLAVRADVDTVDGGGAITALTIDANSDCFPGGTGPITSVTVTEPGEYFKANSAPVSVAVTEQGHFYKEDPDEPPCVADVTVTACGGGESAVINATVDSSPQSPTFGQITALTIADGGINYLAWEWVCTNHEELNGTPIVLAAVNPKKLVTVSLDACFGSGACVVVDPIGPSQDCDGEAITADYDGLPGPIRQITLTQNGGGYAILGREDPQWTHTAYGWTFTPLFSEHEDDCGRPYWVVDSIDPGGSGQSTIPDGLLLNIVVTGDEKCEVPAVATVTVEDGVPSFATVTNGGRYYREDASLPPIVATVTPRIIQLPPSSGSGGQVSVTINSTVGSPDFGKITAATLVSGGSGYKILGAPLNCEYFKRVCDVGDVLEVSMVMRGHGKEPHIILRDTRPEPLVYAVFEADDVLADCNTLPYSGTLLYGAAGGTVAITSGGTFTTDCETPALCSACSCPDFDDYCSTIQYTDEIGTDTISDTGYFFGAENGGVGRVTASIVCDEGTGIILLSATLAFLGAVPPCPTSVSFIKRIEFRCSEDCSVVGTYTLELAEPELCAGCDCGSVTWTIAEGPC